MKHLKQEFDKLSFKDTLLYSICILSLVAGFVLLFCAFLTAPKGEIHDSVQTTFGMILLFVGACLGIDLKYSNKTEMIQKMVADFMVKYKADKEKKEAKEE